MQADKVRFPEYEIQIRHTLNIARQNTGVGVITQHPHAEALRGNLRHMAADVAATDDPQGPPGQLEPASRHVGSEHAVRSPLPAEALTHPLGISGAFQHQHNRRFRHCPAVNPRGIGHINTKLFGVGRIHRFVAHAPPGNQLQARSRVHNGSVKTMLRLLKGHQAVAIHNIPANPRLCGLRPAFDLNPMLPQPFYGKRGHIVVHQKSKCHLLAPPYFRELVSACCIRWRDCWA